MNMIETRTIRIQLKPTPEQAYLLQQTMQEYTACFNEVCQLADAEKISNGVELHKLTYAHQRATTHLPSQLICAARVKATEALDIKPNSTCTSYQSPIRNVSTRSAAKARSMSGAASTAFSLT